MMPKMRTQVELVSPSDDGDGDDDGAAGIGAEGRGPLGVLGDCPPTNDAVGRAVEVTAVRSSSIRAPRPPIPADSDWVALAAPRAGMVGESDETVFPDPPTGVGAVGESGATTTCAGGLAPPPPPAGAATLVTGARTGMARVVTGATIGLTVLVTGAKTGMARLVIGATIGLTVLVTGARTGMARLVTGATIGLTVLVTGARTGMAVLVTGVTTGLTALVTGARVWATGAVTAPAVCATVPSVWVTGAATVPSVWVTGAATVPSVWATGAVTAPAAGVAVPRVVATALVATVDVTGPVTVPAPRVGTGPEIVPAAGVAVPRVGATALVTTVAVDTGVGGAGVVVGVPAATGVDELPTPGVGGAAVGGEGLDGPVAGAATASLDEATGLNVELTTPPIPDGATADVGIPRADALPEPRSTTKATTAKIPNSRRANARDGRMGSVAPYSHLLASNRVFVDATGSTPLRGCPANRSFRPVRGSDNPAGPLKKPVLSAHIGPGVTAIGMSPGNNGPMPAGSFRVQSVLRGREVSSHCRETSAVDAPGTQFPGLAIQRLGRVRCVALPGTPQQLSANTGCREATSAHSASVESGVTPSKNIPVSNFQRRR